MSKEINHKELRWTIRCFYNAKEPLYIKGATGIGKSWAIKDEAKAIAKDEKREFFDWNNMSSEEKHKVLDSRSEKVFLFADLRLNQKDQTDLNGLPGLNGKDYVEWKHNLLFKVCSLPNIAGIVFFDEMNLAPPSVQASAYQIVLDKCIGELSLNPNVFVIAAGNRSEDRANVFETAAPLNNRFGHYTLMRPSDDEFCDWGMDNDIDSRVLTFIKFKPSLLHNFKADNVEEAFPTHRSWAAVSNLLKNNQTKNHQEIERLAAGRVGVGAAKEFASYIKLKDKIDISAILKDPKTIKNITEIDQMYSVISALVETYKKDKKSLEAIFQVTENIPQKEFAVFLVRLLKASNKGGIAKDAGVCKTWPQVAKDFGRFIID